jgi:hypothetical protein
MILTCAGVNVLSSKSTCIKATFILLNKSIEAQFLPHSVILHLQILGSRCSLAAKREIINENDNSPVREHFKRLTCEYNLTREAVDESPMRSNHCSVSSLESLSANFLPIFRIPSPRSLMGACRPNRQV